MKLNRVSNVVVEIIELDGGTYIKFLCSVHIRQSELVNIIKTQYE